MWIAEKLIVVDSGNMGEAEDLAEDFLNDLVSRNLIQVAKRTYDGRISSCRIYDLLHSLCVELAKESNFFHTEHNAFCDPDNVAKVRRITFYSDDNAMNEFFRLNPKPKKLRALFCFIKDHCIFSQMAHLDFKLLQVLVVVMCKNYYHRVIIPNKIGNMSCLHYLRLEEQIIDMPNNIVKIKHLETLDVRRSYTMLPSGVWESKQLRHLLDGGFGQASSGCFSISPFCPNKYSLLPKNLQTLMWIEDKYFEPTLLHRLINLRRLGIGGASSSTVKILSALSPHVPNALEVLKLRFSCYMSEPVNLSSYPNTVELYMRYRSLVSLNIEAFPPNLGKLTLFGFMVDRQLLAALKKLPKLRVLELMWFEFNDEKMDLSGEANGNSFPQLEVLHIESGRLSELTCTDEVSMPKLKKLSLVELNSPIILSERLA